MHTHTTHQVKTQSSHSNLDGQNNDFHNVSLQCRRERKRGRALARKKVRERALSFFLAVGVLLSLALLELLVLDSNSSAVQPCGVGGWEGEGVGSNWYSKMPGPWRTRMPFLSGRGLCVHWEVKATVDWPPSLFLLFFSLLFSLSLSLPLIYFSVLLLPHVYCGSMWFLI